jgi:hypothetical protein
LIGKKLYVYVKEFSLLINRETKADMIDMTGKYARVIAAKYSLGTPLLTILGLNKSSVPKAILNLNKHLYNLIR